MSPSKPSGMTSIALPLIQVYSHPTSPLLTEAHPMDKGEDFEVEPVTSSKVTAMQVTQTAPMDEVQDRDSQDDEVNDDGQDDSNKDDTTARKDEDEDDTNSNDAPDPGSDSIQPMDVDVTDTFAINLALEAASLHRITLPWTPIPHPQLIAFQDCEVGINPKVALKHSKGHKVRLSKNQEDILKDFLVTAELATEKDKLPPPPANSAPIEGLEVKQGFKCKLCDYCVPSSSTMKNHFSGEHHGV